MLFKYMICMVNFDSVLCLVFIAGPKYVVQIGEKAVDYNENFKCVLKPS